MIKPQIQLEKFTYASAQPLGNAGFVLIDVVAVMPASPSTGDKASTLKIDKVTVEELDFERMKDINDDDMPRFAKLKLEGMNGDEEMFTALTPYGVPRVPVDVVLDYRLDGAAKTFTPTKLEIALRGQARIGLALTMDASARNRARLPAPGTAAAHRHADARRQRPAPSLPPPIAKEQGQTADGVAAMALVSIAAFCDGQVRRR